MFTASPGGNEGDAFLRQLRGQDAEVLNGGLVSLTAGQGMADFSNPKEEW